jgi:hypothetical protein
MVQHEIKELGMHALVCTVTYGARTIGEGGKETLLSRSFRKVRFLFRTQAKSSN